MVTRSKVKVLGARKIWGTIKTCSPGAVSATISKLVSSNLTLRVRHKTKTLANNKSVWRFVVHGSENDFAILDRDWSNVHAHTL